MTTYSYRAECQADSDSFLESIREFSTLEVRVSRTDGIFPDVEVEFESSCDLSELHDVLSKLVDVHVIRDTLWAVPLSKNPLFRPGRHH